MQEVYSIPLSQLCEEFSLEKVYVPEHFEEIMITTPEISRPGLALAGFYEIFDAARIQIIGYAEYRYLETLPPEVRKQNITNYINATPVAVVHSSSAPVMEEMLEAAARVRVYEQRADGSLAQLDSRAVKAASGLDATLSLTSGTYFVEVASLDAGAGQYNTAYSLTLEKEEQQAAEEAQERFSNLA